MYQFIVFWLWPALLSWSVCRAQTCTFSYTPENLTTLSDLRPTTSFTNVQTITELGCLTSPLTLTAMRVLQNLPKQPEDMETVVLNVQSGFVLMTFTFPLPVASLQPGESIILSDSWQGFPQNVNAVPPSNHTIYVPSSITLTNTDSMSMSSMSMSQMTMSTMMMSPSSTSMPPLTTTIFTAPSVIPTSNTAAPVSSQSLSPGVIAGIVSGAIVLFLIANVFVWLYLNERRKNKTQYGAPLDPSYDSRRIENRSPLDITSINIAAESIVEKATRDSSHQSDKP